MLDSRAARAVVVRAGGQQRQPGAVDSRADFRIVHRLPVSRTLPGLTTNGSL